MNRAEVYYKTESNSNDYLTVVFPHTTMKGVTINFFGFDKNVKKNGRSLYGVKFVKILRGVFKGVVDKNKGDEIEVFTVKYLSLELFVY
jgi:hypothetical protein